MHNHGIVFNNGILACHVFMVAKDDKNSLSQINCTTGTCHRYACYFFFLINIKHTLFICREANFIIHKINGRLLHVLNVVIAGQTVLVHACIYIYLDIFFAISC